MNKISGLIDHLSGIDDPRIERTKRHKLIDILVIGVVGTLCGAGGWEEIQFIAEEKEKWLRKFLELPNGIPSHDTIARVFARISPQAFQANFAAWMKEVAQVTDGEIVAIDGKRVRGSHDRSKGKAAIHMVSAWAAGNGVVLGQLKVDDKSNEITAIPKLLSLLELTGCIVTIDAMGCQIQIASDIVAAGADYVLGLKGNQGSTLEAVTKFFDKTKLDSEKAYTTVDNDHGRLEERTYHAAGAAGIEDIEKWPEIQSIVMVTSTRESGLSKTSERRFYLSSLPIDASNLARAIRGHWGIENSLHWVLDVTFDEDRKRIRNGEAAENCAVLRHVALNLLKSETSFKGSIKRKRLKCCMSNKYLAKALGQAF